MLSTKLNASAAGNLLQLLGVGLASGTARPRLWFDAAAERLVKGREIAVRILRRQAGAHADQRKAAVLRVNMVDAARPGPSDRLTRNLQALAQIIATHRGQLFAARGESALDALLPDAVTAVEAAMAIQDLAVSQNADQPAGEQLKYCVGIDYGRISVADSLSGEAVTAARTLAGLARTGTLLISGRVFRAIRPRLHFSYRPRGKYHVPGSASPLQIYQIKRAPSGELRRSTLRSAGLAWRPGAGLSWRAATATVALIVGVGTGWYAYQHLGVEPRRDSAPMADASLDASAGNREQAATSSQTNPPERSRPLEDGAATANAAQLEAESALAPTSPGEARALSEHPAGVATTEQSAAEGTGETRPSPLAETAPQSEASAAQSRSSVAAESPPERDRDALGEAMAALQALIQAPNPDQLDAGQGPAAPEVAAAKSDAAPEVGAAAVDAATPDLAPKIGESTPTEATAVELAALEEVPDSSFSAAAAHPSIVVLPFSNPTRDPGRDYFSDGVTETLISSLSRFPHLQVIASDSAFDFKGAAMHPAAIAQELGVEYVLAGTATRTGRDIMVTASLIEAGSGTEVWTQPFTMRSRDPSSAQGALVQRVLLSLEGRDPEPAPAIDPGLGPVGTVSLEAYDYAMQWRSLFDRFRQADNVRAREAALRAVELDPGYAAAYAFVAWTYMADYWWGWSSAPAAALEEARRWATRAVQQDPRDYNAHWALADVYQAAGEYDQAVRAYETATTLNPQVAALLGDFGTWMLPLQGRADEGIALARRAMELNPRHADAYSGNLAFNYYLLGAYNDAIASVKRMVDPRLDHRLYLAASYAKAGRLEDAKLEIAKALEEHPDLTVEQFLATFPFKEDSDREHLRDGLRLAGLPTESS